MLWSDDYQISDSPHCTVAVINDSVDINLENSKSLVGINNVKVSQNRSTYAYCSSADGINAEGRYTRFGEEKIRELFLVFDKQHQYFLNFISIKKMIEELRLDLPSSPNALRQSLKDFNINLSTDKESRVIMTFQDFLKYYQSVSSELLESNLKQCKINVKEIPDYFTIIPNYLNRDPFNSSNISLSVASSDQSNLPEPIPSKPIEAPNLNQNYSFEDDYEDQSDNENVAKNSEEIKKEKKTEENNTNTNNANNNNRKSSDIENYLDDNDDNESDDDEEQHEEDKYDENKNDQQEKEDDEEQQQQVEENEEVKQQMSILQQQEQEQQEKNQMMQDLNNRNYRNEIKNEDDFKYFSHIDPLSQIKATFSISSSSDSSASLPETELPYFNPTKRERDDLKTKPASINSQPITKSSYGSAKPTYIPSDDISSEATLRSIPPPNMINDSLPFPMIECPNFILDCECQLKIQLSTDPNLFGQFHRLYPVSNALVEKAEILRKALQLTSCTMRKEKCQLIIQELEKYDLSRYRSIDQYIYDEINGFRPTLAEECDLKLSNPNYAKLSEILSYFYRDKVKSSNKRSVSRMSKRMSIDNAERNNKNNNTNTEKPLRSTRSVSTPKYYKYESLADKIKITCLTCEGDELTMEKYRKDYREQHDSIMTIKLLREGLDLCGIELKSDKEYDQYLYYITCALNNIKFDFNGTYKNNLTCLQFLTYVKRIAFNANTSQDELHKITDLEKMYSPEKLMPESVRARNVLRKNLCPGKKVQKPIDYDVTDMYDFESELVSIFNRDFNKFIKFRQVFITDKTQRYVITLINKGLLCIGVRPIKSKNSKSIPLAPIILEIIRKLKINKDENVNEKDFVIEELKKENVIESSKYDAIYYLIMSIFLNRNSKFITAEYIKYFYVKKVKYILTDVEAFDLATIRKDFKKLLKVSLYTQSMKNILCSRFMKGISTIQYKCLLVYVKQYIQFLSEVHHVVALDDFIKHITKRIRKVKHYTKPLDFDIEKQQIMEEILGGNLLRENMINPYDCIVRYYNIPENFLYCEILNQTIQYMLTSASVKIIEKLQNENKTKFRATKEAFQWKKKNNILEIMENLRSDKSILVPIYLGFRRMITSGNSGTIDSYFESRIEALKGESIKYKYLRQIDIDILEGSKSLDEYRKSIIDSIENPKNTGNETTEMEEEGGNGDNDDEFNDEVKEDSEMVDDFDKDESENKSSFQQEKCKEKEVKNEEEETENYSGIWSEEEEDNIEREKEAKRKQREKEKKEKKAMEERIKEEVRKIEEEQKKKEKEKKNKKSGGDEFEEENDNDEEEGEEEEEEEGSETERKIREEAKRRVEEKNRKRKEEEKKKEENDREVRRRIKEFEQKNKKCIPEYKKIEIQQKKQIKLIEKEKTKRIKKIKHKHPGIDQKENIKKKYYDIKEKKWKFRPPYHPVQRPPEEDWRPTAIINEDNHNDGFKKVIKEIKKMRRR